ncbi:MAG: hypothetical protein Ct9H300mP32_5750 [Verrucomicrobiota bacterium]|nr:MAG: hypothetical protein Ct9H300mP32_5750 [Verrucomicrobiota bacterium]
MKTQLPISIDPIDEAALVKRREMGDGLGAVVCFSGVVRGREGHASITAIDYEAHEEMARHQFGLIFEAIEQRWPGIRSPGSSTRLGPVNEPSLWVEVIAPHRAEGVRRLPIPYRRDEAEGSYLEKTTAGLAQNIAGPVEGLFAAGEFASELAVTDVLSSLPSSDPGAWPSAIRSPPSNSGFCSSGLVLELGKPGLQKLEISSLPVEARLSSRCNASSTGKVGRRNSFRNVAGRICCAAFNCM